MTVTAYLEHVAIRVADPAPLVSFFSAVLGMGIREIDGPADAPRQVWLDGGLQLVRRLQPDGEDGRPLHLGLMVDDLDAAIAAALRHGARNLPKGANWLVLPDGLVLELMQAAGNSVARMRAIDARG